MKSPSRRKTNSTWRKLKRTKAMRHSAKCFSTFNVQRLDTISLLLVSIEVSQHVESDEEKQSRKEGKERNEE
jgi:hypothetical protein